MTSTFEDIQISELDHERCQKSGTAPFMYNMYLQLTANPPHEWQQIFYQERKIPRHSKWRRAWIEHNYIVVDCIPEELEQYLLDDLKEAVRNCNKKYRAYLDHLEKERRAGREAARKERERLRALSLRLRYD